MKRQRATTSFILAVCALALAGSAAAATPNAAGRLVVKVGARHSYTRSELRPGETVVCRYLHHSLSVQAPSGDEEGAGTVWPKPGTTNNGLFHLNVNVVAGKGYAVICGLGGYHWGGPVR
jgi:hypothetical protein